MEGEREPSLGEWILREYVKLFFPYHETLYNYRPEWLREECPVCGGLGTTMTRNLAGALVEAPCAADCDDGKTSQPLELDIYLPNDAIAFEYQGEQHTRSTLGEKGVPRRPERRDAFKRTACEGQGIGLYQIFRPGLSYTALRVTLERVLEDDVLKSMRFIQLEAQARRYRA